MKNKMLLTPFFIDESLPGLKSLVKEDWQINEPTLLPGDKQQRLVTINKPLRDMVADALNQGQRPVSIAGDCCTSIGVLSGLQRAGLNPTLLWLDAHGDFNTWETTPSGFLGGMPLAMLVGRGEQTIVEGVGLKVLPENQVILTDARDLDPDERVALEGSAINHVPDVDTLLDSPLPDGPLYVHFDSDIINPSEAPAMNYLTPGGPSSATLRALFQRLARTGRVIAISVSSWNPEMDGDGRSQKVVMGLLDELCS